MAYVEATVRVQCSNEAGLAVKARECAGLLGIDADRYEAQRNGAPLPPLHDVETVLRAALLEAGCTLVTFEGHYVHRRGAGPVIGLDDLYAVDKARS